MEKEKIFIGLVQTTASENPKDNLYRQMGLIREASEKGAHIVCLQELFNTPYFCVDYNEEYFNWAEPVNGDLVQSLSELAKELGIVIIAPFFEKRAKGVYHNSLVVIDADGSVLGSYRKTHIPDDPGFYEKYYFTPGDEDSGFKVFDTRFGKIGTLICWDQWYPEAARITALKGADILFYPTAIGTLSSEGKKEQKEYQDAWEIIQRSHAIANGCFVASVNRVGKESGSKFWGGSFIAGPFGQVLAKAGNKEEILITEIDLGAIEKHRKTWPFFRDRRIDLYKPILKRVDD
ncbi:MAG: carbon-nitrogen hydrolase [Gracilimonas sp.]|uniref:carbon-nitrogen hydrolase n=1 Tax=Gracilimonas sp. TaxID=1974203 RepID=UPI0019CC39B1|nr:carbon-nitrogen hydrolase [Gracilimonas sp.]MBD3615196.1 carbon-nitrogen hydrolase [Gracilimonas sp.]